MSKRRYLSIAVTGLLAFMSSAQAVVINTQPKSQNVPPGQPFSLTVVATADLPATTLTYQWFLDNAILPGATLATLNVASAQAANQGTYRVVVQDAPGANPPQAISANAVVNVQPKIGIQPVPALSVNEGDPISLFVGSVADDPSTTTLLYQWRRNGLALAGANSATLTIPNAKSTDAGTYTVVVQDSPTAYTPQITSNPSVVTVNLRPKITKPPLARTVDQTKQTIFTVEFSGSTVGATFKWQKYDKISALWNDIPAATSQSYVINAVVPADAGDFRVIVNNITNVPVTSTKATLTVRTGPIITVQPSFPTNPRGVATGGSTVLKVTATGVAPLRYKWLFKAAAAATFSDVPGAKAATLTVKGLEANEGTYKVTIENTLNPLTRPACNFHRFQMRGSLKKLDVGKNSSAIRSLG